MQFDRSTITVQRPKTENWHVHFPAVFKWSDGRTKSGTFAIKLARLQYFKFHGSRTNIAYSIPVLTLDARFSFYRLDNCKYTAQPAISVQEGSPDYGFRTVARFARYSRRDRRKF